MPSIIALAVLVSSVGARAQTPESRPASAPYERAEMKTPAGPFLFDAVEKSFGKIRDTENREIVYRFQNAIATPVRILEVKKSCGCTTAEVTKSVLSPGDVASLIVRYTGAHRQGEERKLVTLVTDAPKKSNAEVILTGTVVAKIAVLPQTVFVGELSLGERSAPKEMKIVSRILDLKPEAPTVDRKDWSVEFVRRTESVDEGDRVAIFVYRVAYAGGTEYGEKRAIISIKSNAAEMPTIAFYGLAVVAPPIRIVPAKDIDLSDPAHRGDLLQPIILSRRDKKPFQLLSYALKDATPELGLTLERQPENPRQKDQIVLYLRGKRPKDLPATGLLVTGLVEMTFDVPEQPEGVLALKGLMLP